MIYIAKHQATQYYIYKLHSGRLKKAKWKLSLPLEEAKRNEDDIIQLSSSQCLRFIDEMNHTEDSDVRAKRIRKKIKELKKKDTPNKSLINSLYDSLYKTRFVEDYVCIIMDSDKDYDRCNSKGFEINGIRYQPFLGTTGGLKKSVVIYVSDKIYDELMKKKDCGRNTKIPTVPEKLGAYEALMCSGSDVVSFPKGIIVVDDCTTIFTEPCYNLDDRETDEPIETYIEDQEFELNVSDGEGLMLPSLAERWNQELGGKPGECLPAGNIRGIPFTKGMAFCMDYIKFGDSIGRYEIVDAWGDKRDIRDSELILTTSMVKLWDSYESMEDFLENIKKYNYKCALAKTAEQECDSERYLNYQFLQSYQLTDEDIKELCQPTIDEIKDVLGLDYRKTLLFLRGTAISERDILNDNGLDYIKALLSEPEMINDPFIRHKIYGLIKKRIKDAKIGKIKVSGNYSIIAGDPYMLMENMFGLEAKGLLRSGQLYHHHWINKDVNKVACFRAPMTSHYNIRVLDVFHDEQCDYWYQYLPSICILNGWDTTCEALNGADKDGDLFFTTDNHILINNYRQLPTICCIQRKGTKRETTHKMILDSYKRAFGDKIGFVTNIITSQINLQWGFDPSSKEYKTLDYRIKCGQLYQQNTIDALKGIEVKPMPLYWYNRRSNNINTSDSQEVADEKHFNQKIVADKKPYFMIYIYPHIMKKYKTYEKNTDGKCMLELGISLTELKEKPLSCLTSEEQEFLNYYYKFLPVSINPCVINRICWLFEKEFDEYLSKKKTTVDFDYSHLKRNIPYSRLQFYKVKKLYTQYNRWLQKLNIDSVKTRIGSDIFNDQFTLRTDYFKTEVYKVCLNPEVLCEILLDICYKNNKTKQFVWDMCGDILVKRLQEKNWNQITYPVRKSNGDILYDGKYFSLETIRLLPNNFEEFQSLEEEEI